MKFCFSVVIVSVYNLYFLSPAICRRWNVGSYGGLPDLQIRFPVSVCLAIC